MSAVTPGRRLRLLILSACFVAVVLPARAGAVALEPVGTFDAPIYVTAPRDDLRLFVIERGGTIRVVKNGVTQATAFLDISTLTTLDGERGLLSMAFDPNFASNGLFYVDYTGDGTDSGGTLGDIHVDEFKVGSNPDVADPLSRRQVLVVNRPSTIASNHNGGQLQFGPDGMLYISVGDGGTGGVPAQDVNSLNGKLLRIDPHRSGTDPYTSPAGNPHVGVTGLDEIWSLGLRNPFRFSFDHLDGTLTIGDVGQSAREEVDYRPQSVGGGRGDNFGWPCREGFIAGTACLGNFTDPIFDYPHADPGGGGAYGCSIIGGYVYRGSDVPALADRFVYADLCTSVLRSLAPALPLGSGDRSDTAAILGNPVGFGEDSRCELYVAAGSYVVSRIVSTPGASPGTGTCAGSNLPPPPSFTQTSPASGSNDSSPEIRGSAVPGTVRLYPNATCTGTPAATGSATNFASPGLTVSVPDNSSTTFHAENTNANGNSVCSTSTITYLEVTPSPAAPSSSRPGLTLGLEAGKHRVSRGHKVLLEARSVPCLGAGERVQLFRRGRLIKARNLSAGCQAKFRVRIDHRSTFSATIAESSGHQAATSDPVKVEIKHAKRSR